MDQEPNRPLGYNRPTSKWSCGDDVGCRRGPTPSGHCCAEPDCQPQQVDGRWLCRRSIARGGVCATGPGPDGSCGCAVRVCHPRPSLRRTRGRVVLLSTAIAVAIATMALTSRWNGALLAPGPLCAKHARVLGDLQGMDRCARCHAAAESSSWAAKLAPWGAVGATQSNKCLECHSSTLGRTAARSPHNVIPTQLASLTEEKRQRLGESSLTLVGHFDRLLGPAAAVDALECSTCHREHRGETDLAVLTDRQCQTCHVSSFNRFETDHPEFTSFPTSFERHLAFNHATHEQKHFAEKGVSYSCDQCHMADTTRRVQLLRPFEVSCGKCHTAPIEAASLDGIELVRLPMLDVDRLRSSGLEPGDWPAEATGDFDGELGPLTLALLSGDGAARQAIENLGGRVDLLLVDADDPQQLAAINTIAWSLKRLIWELAQGDRAAIAARLERAGAADAIACRELAAALPTSQLEELVAVWLPDLEFELQRIEASPSVSPSAMQLPNAAPSGFDRLIAEAVNQEPKRAANQETEFDSVSYSQAQQPARLPLADNPLSSLLQNQAALVAGGVPTPAPAESEPPLTAVPQETRGAEANVSGSTNGSAALLAENPLRFLRASETQGGATIQPEIENPSVVITPDPEDVPAVETQTEEPLANNPLAESESSEPMNQDLAQMESTDEQSESSAGELIEEAGEVLPWRFTPTKRVGWMRDDASFVFRYHPKGHGDGVVAKLIEIVVGSSVDRTAPKSEGSADDSTDQASASASDVAASANRHDRVDAIVAAFASSRTTLETQTESRPIESNRLNPLQPLAMKLLGTASFGACASCHQAPGVDSGRPMAWRAWRREVSRGEFTRFAHGPHLTQIELSDCRSCHRLASDQAGELRAAAFSANADRSLDVNPHSDFASLTKMSCANCHQAGRAPNRCTTCHDYHVGTERLHP